MLACGEEEYGGTDTQCGVGVSLHSRTHPLFMHVAQYGLPVSELVSFAFSTIPICPFLIQRIFQ